MINERTILGQTMGDREVEVSDRFSLMGDGDGMGRNMFLSMHKSSGLPTPEKDGRKCSVDGCGQWSLTATRSTANPVCQKHLQELTGKEVEDEPSGDS